MNRFLALRIRYYQQQLKKMSPIERYAWADEHPAAKRLLGLRGLSDLSLAEKATFYLAESDEKKHE